MLVWMIVFFSVPLYNPYENHLFLPGDIPDSECNRFFVESVFFYQRFESEFDPFFITGDLLSRSVVGSYLI